MTYASEAGHWYKRDGTPCYEIPGKNGELRPTTLRDARKLDLVPSVSGIIKCAAAPALEAWKQDRLLEMASTLHPIDGEIFKDYCARIKALERERAAIAPDLGSAIHTCIERHLLGQDYDQTHKQCVDGALACIDGWCGLADLRPEKSFAHPLGYGGKCDIHKLGKFGKVIGGPHYTGGYVADFKSKDFGSGDNPQAYDNHAMQLSAYRHGFGMPSARCAIIFVSTKEPGLTHLVEVSQDELEKGWRMFCALLTYWKAKNGVE